jgi:hypothetical protein
MSQVLKGFMGVFLVLFLMATSTGMIGAFYQMLHAQNTHASMINELENSNYARNVMETCFEVAEKQDYRLQLSLYLDTEERKICTRSTDIPETTANVTMVEVVLCYDIRIAFFDVSTEQQLSGYAR